MENKRNYGLDTLKLICAMLVICIHTPFPNDFGQYVMVISRIAVPIFLMITGFYYNKAYILKYT